MAFFNLSHLNALAATGPKVAQLPEIQAAMADGGFISCNVVNGRGDLQFRKLDGVWHHRTCYVDHCFGQINQRWQPLAAAPAAFNPADAAIGMYADD